VPGMSWQWPPCSNPNPASAHTTTNHRMSAQRAVCRREGLTGSGYVTENGLSCGPPPATLACLIGTLSSRQPRIEQVIYGYGVLWRHG
jgi:hypothetical protein